MFGYHSDSWRAIHESPFSAVVVAAAVGVAALLRAQSLPATVDVQVLAINDFHGALEPASGANGRIGTTDAGGIEYLATHLARLRRTNPNTVIVSAGDNIGATPLLSSLSHDEATIEALSLAGLDVSAVGNHELDEGWWELRRIQHGGCHPVDGCLAGDGVQGGHLLLCRREHHARSQSGRFRHARASGAARDRSPGGCFLRTPSVSWVACG